MVDTVKLNIAAHSHNKVIECLTQVKGKRDYDTGLSSHIGKLENMTVIVFPECVRIIGSLAKFFYGNNMERFSRAGVKQGIEKLSDILGLPVNKASVWRFDVGESMIVERPVKEYLGFLGESRYFQRDTFGNGNLMYKNKVRAMVFYDKPEEMKKNKQIIPMHFQGFNILRYELKFNKRLASQFGERIKAFKLFEEDFYSGIINKWKQEYFKITRLRQYRLKAFKMSNGKELKNQIALMGLQGIGGVQAFFKMLDCERAAGHLDRFKYKRLRDMVKSISNTEAFIVPNDCILELDEKVRQAVEINLN